VTLARFVKEMMLEIDYDNFKNAVARERPEDTGLPRLPPNYHPRDGNPGAGLP
jgi:hypothetical protein